ncbi:MAG TPA: nickel pincer cofactor biosynthesis protein LarC [Desulfobacteraceae bacterium]|nr:nickel pincer cofactor biosynthesis protein LarC [Desulfobacteraceae bacterium]
MIAYFDLFSGISGDMTLGAFVDLGVPVDWLRKKIATLLVDGFDIRAEDTWHNGIKAVNIFVDAEENPPARHYTAIKKLISDSPLSERVKNLSLSAFEKIARAEAAIHGSDLETVHFHEVGGIDAVVDIVGAFLCVEYLGITQVSASTVAVGSGSVRCSHGVIPVPVPAVAAMLQGIPVKPSNAEMELVTPTGAAIITTLATGFGRMPEMVMDRTGYGAGKRESSAGLPNLLRIVTGREVADKPESPLRSAGFVTQESVFVVETSIDDMNPEFSGYLMERLFQANALDVCFFPVQMKKNRPGTRLEVVCRPKDVQGIIDLVLSESTTTGVRCHEQQRMVLPREETSVQTGFGTVSVKKITDPDGNDRLMPEFEVCRAIALQKKMPLKDVYRQVCLDMDRSRL